MQNLKIGLMLLCLVTLLSCTKDKAPPLIINPCPLATTCIAQNIIIKTNRDLLQEVDNLRAALAFCNKQIEIINTCQMELNNAAP